MRNVLIAIAGGLAMSCIVMGLVTATTARAEPSTSRPLPHWALIYVVNDKPDHIDGYSSATSCQRSLDYLKHANDGMIHMASLTGRCVVVE